MSIDYKDFIKLCTVTGGPRRTNTVLDTADWNTAHFVFQNTAVVSGDFSSVPPHKPSPYSR